MTAAPGHSSPAVSDAVLTTFRASAREGIEDDAAPAVSCTARARWALVAELVSIGRHVIGSAVEYTGPRKQHGRLIGTFQTLQQRWASAHACVVGDSGVAAKIGSR